MRGSVEFTGGFAGVTGELWCGLLVFPGAEESEHALEAGIVDEVRGEEPVVQVIADGEE